MIIVGGRPRGPGAQWPEVLRKTGGVPVLKVPREQNRDLRVVLTCDHERP